MNVGKNNEFPGEKIPFNMNRPFPFLFEINFLRFANLSSKKLVRTPFLIIISTWIVLGSS